MSFLYKTDLGTSTPPIALVINALAGPGDAPVEHTPEPMDASNLSRLSDTTLFVANPALSGFDVAAGVLRCDPATWAHVNWSASYYGDVPTSFVRVVGVMVAGVAFLDGPGFPFAPPSWDNRVGFPDPPEFHLVWNPDGGPIVDFVNPAGGQAGSASWDDATKTLTIVPQTYHPQTVFGAQGLELVPVPQFVDPTPLVIPPQFGASKGSPEPTALALSLVVPPVFGGLTVTPGSPGDVPPDEPPPPGGDPYGPPDGRPVVDSGGAVPGADATGRSAATRVSRLRVVG